MELASKSPWLNGKASGHESKENLKGWFKAHTVHVSIEIKRIWAGISWKSREGIVGEVSRVKIKRRTMKRRLKVPKIFFFVCRKNKKKSN